MTSYWLTPLIRRKPLTLGKSRIRCTPEFITAFRDLLNAIHPRCLMLFKANLFVSDERTGSCGNSKALFSLDCDQDIVFEAETLPLAHCAEAFLQRLTDPQQVRAWVKQADRSGFSDIQSGWLQQTDDWLRSGYDVVLIREDGNG